MTLAIEPMVDLGSAEVVWMDDDWTVVTEDWCFPRIMRTRF